MDNRSNRAFPRRMVIALTAVFLAILAGGAAFYKFQEQRQLRQVEANLTAIARLKADQITEWRKKQLDDAGILTERIALVADVKHYLDGPSPVAAEETLRRFRSLMKHARYHDILLVDPDGKVRLSIGGYSGTYHAGASGALAVALRDHKAVLTELHTEKNAPTPHIGVVTPLFSDDGAFRPIGAVILVKDAREFLYPLIQFWPLPSRSSETLLVRRDGDSVLYLNDLRHRTDTALKLRLPLSRTDLPAVMAVLGQHGFMMGRDYRGIEVAAVILPVPNSPWFMVAKVDASEAFAEWRFRSALILLLFAALMGMTIGSGLVVWQREKKEYYRVLFRSETALHAIAERHGITLKSIGDGVIVTDADGRVEMLNPVAEALTGWNDGEAHGRTLAEIFPIINEETRAPVESPVTRVLRDGAIVGLANHTLLINRDGAERPIADSGAPIRDESGNNTGVVLVFRDQTEERLVMRMATIRLALIEYAVTHSMDELMSRALDEIGEFVGSPIGFYHFVESDQNTLSLQQWSTRTLKEFCRAEGKDMHYPIEQAGVWADCAREKKPIVHNDYKSLKHKKGMPEGHAEVIRELVVPVLRQEKVVSILGVGNKPVEYTDKDVEAVCYLADVIWEIVSHKRTEEARQNSEKRYRRLFESAKDGILIMDAGTEKVIDVNPFLLQLLGYPHDALIGKHLWEIGPFKDIAASKDAFEILKSKEYVRYEDLPLETSDGRIVQVEFVSNVYLVDHTKVIQCNIRDITDRKRAEKERERLTVQLQQAQKMESVGRLAGGVAHDFNNMMGIILGYTEMAKNKTDADDPLYDDLKEISIAAHRSAELTRQLLAFARKQINVPRPIDLNEAVEGMLKMLRRIIGEDIDLVWQPGTGLWPVNIDPTQIDQILANLLVNARDAISGVGRITIETDHVHLDKTDCAGHAESVPGEFVLLTVSDSGRGMDRETLNNLFEPFFTTKGVGEGTGLGLATVYGIVKQNNGFVNVYSEPGQGATFKIYLPRHAGKTDEIAAPDTAELPEGNGETVLVVEDEASILRLAKKMLTGLGYKVLAAPTPTSALKLAGEHGDDIDLLVTDVIMPEMNGRDLAEQLHALSPGLKVLFMSGYTADVIAHRGILEEGMHFIQKPFSNKELAVRVREALGNDE